MDERIQHLVFHLNDRSFGLRLAQIERVIRAVDCTPLQLAPSPVIGVIDLHGRIIPVLSLRRKWGLTDREISMSDQFIIAITSHRTVAIVVDEVGDVVEHSPRAIVTPDNVFSQPGGIQGVTQLEDRLMLIHDLDQFLSLDEQQALDAAMTAATHAT